MNALQSVLTNGPPSRIIPIGRELAMLRVVGRVRAAATACYLSGTREMVHRLIGGRSGPRDFHRIVIAGPLGRQNGVGQGAYLQWTALRRRGVDAELIDAAPGLRNPLCRVGHQPGSAYVIHAGGPQAANLLATVLPHAARAHRVAYFAWELPDPPPDWAGCDRHFDEIWTPSTFSRESLRKLIDRPIHVVPHHVTAQTMRERDDCWPFTVLVMADSRSSLSRKNPEGALRSFQLAFGASPRARLILKLNGRPAELDAFERSCGHLLAARNVKVIRSYLHGTALAQLYRSADVLLSMHRAEGFGLPLLEAMAHGVPAVATGWSGNMDFMSPLDSELVPYRLVPVQDLSRIYSGSMWAEPDIEAAACALRRLADDRAHYFKIATAAYHRVANAPSLFPFKVPEHAVSS